MKEKFLPIGTIVKLKGGIKEVMITSYCIFPTNTQIVDGRKVSAPKKIYEYGGCTYPEGIIDSNVACAFNHEQIEEILHLGYETDEQRKLSMVLNEGYEAYKKKYENGENL